MNSHKNPQSTYEWKAWKCKIAEIAYNMKKYAKHSKYTTFYNALYVKRSSVKILLF